MTRQRGWIGRLTSGVGVTIANILMMGLLLSAGSAAAEVTLPHVIGDHMVLQRGIPLRVWGWADPGEKVSVTIAGNTETGTADAAGEWMVILPRMDAGGPHEMTVVGKNTIRLTDILVGEVWLCSGQSNMEWTVGWAKDAEQEIAAADHPSIRLFKVPRRAAGQPMPDVDAVWRVCAPETVGGFSAVGYYFGRALRTELDVPVGLIAASWGGTRIHTWTPREAFSEATGFEETAIEIGEKTMRYREDVGASLDAIGAWIDEARAAIDEGRTIPLRPHIPIHPLENAGQPTGLYNGMIHPLVPFAIRGAIWYQGEANVWLNDGMLYFDKKKAMLGGWRQAWGQGDFPFYYVQLAPHGYKRRRPDTPADALAKIWEAQTASLSIPNTGMVVTTDIGHITNIHPRNKQEVGRRLALWALAKTYGKADMIYSGPLYKSMKVKGAKIRLEFDHTGSGLASRDGKPLTWFQIAGEDKAFVEAQAEVDGNAVVVWSDEVQEPVAVRFGWDMEAEPNLMNKEGLPASPFRTDRW